MILTPEGDGNPASIRERDHELWNILRTVAFENSELHVNLDQRVENNLNEKYRRITNISDQGM